jgi:hypothetical protein
VTRGAGAGPHLWLRVGLFFGAAFLWIASLVTGIMELTLVAIAVLGVSVALRFLPERGR